MKENHQLVASFGDDARVSLPAAIFNAAFASAGLSWSFIPFRAEPTTLAGLFDRLRGEGLAGADFGPSCKEAAAALCDELDAEAELLKAVTTVRLRGAVVEGFNVDVYAFTRALEELGFAAAGKPALILDVGPTARAYGLALERAGARVTYAAVEMTRPRPGTSTQATVIRTDDVAAFLAARRPALLVGAPADSPAFDYGVIPPDCFVYEPAYDRPTPLLRAAEERTLPHADGLNALLFAAERAFALWTGREAPRDVMRRAAQLELEKRNL
jgi:shikimate dehydrogenase